MSVPDEAERKPHATDLKDVVEGGEAISVLSQLRQQPSPATNISVIERCRSWLQPGVDPVRPEKGIFTGAGPIAGLSQDGGPSLPTKHSLDVACK
jgi:hypothetical protein